MCIPDLPPEIFEHIVDRPGIELAKVARVNRLINKQITAILLRTLKAIHPPLANCPTNEVELATAKLKWRRVVAIPDFMKKHSKNFPVVSKERYAILMCAYANSLNHFQLILFPKSFGQITPMNQDPKLKEKQNALAKILKSDQNSLRKIEINAPWDSEDSNPFHRFYYLPSEIGLLTCLEILNLSSHRLTFLPKEIGELTNLTKLLVPDNLLTTFPKEIASCTKLTTLDFSRNPIEHLPEELLQLKKNRCNIS